MLEPESKINSVETREGTGLFWEVWSRERYRIIESQGVTTNNITVLSFEPENSSFVYVFIT